MVTYLPDVPFTTPVKLLTPTYERNSKGSKEKVFPYNVELSAYDDWREGVKYTDDAHVSAYGRNHIARKLTAWLNTI